MKLCPKCFSELPEVANYCPICGELLKEFEELEVNTPHLGLCKRIVCGLKDKAIQL